ncbi:MAG: hypothetical protein R3F20_02590 [Planctomycetota bacterium]
MLSLSILDGESGETLWSGESRARLRTLAQGYGLATLQWREVEEERRWPTAELVETLLDASPLRSVDPARRAELTQPSGLLGRRAKRDLYRRLYETTPAR